MIITLSSPYCFIAELWYLKHHSFLVKLSIYWWNQCKNLLNKDHTYSGCYFSFLLCWSQRCLNCFCNFSVILWSFILLSEFVSYQTTTHSVPKYPCLIVRRSSPSLCKCWKLLAFCSCVWVFFNLPCFEGCIYTLSFLLYSFFGFQFNPEVTGQPVTIVTKTLWVWPSANSLSTTIIQFIKSKSMKSPQVINWQVTKNLEEFFYNSETCKVCGFPSHGWISPELEGCELSHHGVFCHWGSVLLYYDILEESAFKVAGRGSQLS